MSIDGQLELIQVQADLARETLQDMTKLLLQMTESTAKIELMLIGQAEALLQLSQIGLEIIQRLPAGPPGSGAIH